MIKSSRFCIGSVVMPCSLRAVITLKANISQGRLMLRLDLPHARQSSNQFDSALT